MTTVTVATFEDMDSAERLKERLTKEGFHAEVQDDSKFQKHRLVDQPHAAIHVNVRRQELDQAMQRLQDIDQTEGPSQTAIHCPQCKSGRVEYPQVTRKFSSPAFVSLFFALGIVEKKFYCVDCQFTWSTAPHPQVDRDVLGWKKAPAPPAGPSGAA